MIEHFNPWWKGREGIEEDEDYRKWIGSEVRWVPEVINIPRTFFSQYNIWPQTGWKNYPIEAHSKETPR